MLGDMLLAAGQAKLLHRKIGRKVTIGNPRTGEVLWNELYDFIPYLEKSGDVWVVDYKGNRGYADGSAKLPDGRMLQLFFKKKYRAEPAQIEIDPEPNDYVIIEPSIKKGAPLGKQWHGYQKVVDGYDAEFVQLNQDTLRGVKRINTTLTEATRLIKGCRAYIGTEGFLHHLAAAFGKPAVVLMGAFVPPMSFGYEGQISLAVNDPKECGSCYYTGAMNRIPVGAAVGALDDALSGKIKGKEIRYY